MTVLAGTRPRRRLRSSGGALAAVAGVAVVHISDHPLAQVLSLSDVPVQAGSHVGRLQNLQNPQRVMVQPVRQKHGQRRTKIEETALLHRLSRRAALVVAGCGTAAASNIWFRQRVKGVGDAAGAAIDTMANVVEKTPLDERTFTPITLPNGLRTLLISDPNCDKAAAALDVHVGYFSDPEKLPGLAHFCEHMLFLGTDAFPEENSFETYLSSHGGFSNAFTDDEDTCFFFGCANDALSGGLERFASFFTGPLFTVSATDREVNAINSEHLKNIQDDSFRLKQLLAKRANPAHPCSHFGTGTRATLLEKPATMGIDLRSSLVSHFKSFYRAPLMTLCIVGREQPSELVTLVERFFSAIPGSVDYPAASPADKWATTPPFLEDAFDVQVDAVPVTDTRAIQIGFPISFGTGAGYMDRNIWRKLIPSAYVASVIGHEGPRSLCALLRRRGFATGLTAGTGDNNDAFCTFNIVVELTETGLEKRQEVLELIFGYLRLLRDLREWPAELIQENIMLSEANWRTAEEPGPSDAVVQLAGNMHTYKMPRKYLSGGRRLEGGAELQDAIKIVLTALTPRNALVTSISRSFEVTADQAEPWYGTRFRSQPASFDRRRWETAKPAPELGLQPPNPFVPRSLDLKAPRAPRLARGVSPPPPEQRRLDDRWLVFFKQDTEFGVPRAYVCIELLTAYPRSSARAAATARLYELMLVDALTETLLYDASVAGLTFFLTTSARGIELFFGGYDDRLVDFARASVAATLSFDPGANVPRFNAQRDLAVRELEGLLSEQPFQQAGYWTGLATNQPNFTFEEILMEFKKAQVSDVVEFKSQIWQRERLFGRALCQGNLRPDEADALIDTVQKAIQFKPLPKDEWPAPKIMQVPARSEGVGSMIIKKTLDLAEQNSAVELNYQLGVARVLTQDGRQTWATLQVLAAALRDRFYTELRTRQQLGYVVTCFADRKEGVPRLVFVVQGAVLDPLGILSRIDAFLKQARSDLAMQSEADLQAIAGSLASSRLTRATQLGTSVERTWGEIRCRELRWDRAVVEAAALQGVKRADVLDMFDRYIRERGQERRRLATLVYGSEHSVQFNTAAADAEAAGGNIIKDVKAFALAQPAWPPREV